MSCCPDQDVCGPKSKFLRDTVPNTTRSNRESDVFCSRLHENNYCLIALSFAQLSLLVAVADA